MKRTWHLAERDIFEEAIDRVPVVFGEFGLFPERVLLKSDF
jgi:hypothetical protein